MSTHETETLQSLRLLADQLGDRLEELTERLTTTASTLARIQDAYDRLPHPADLEGLADVTERISRALACAEESWNALPDERRIADTIELTQR